MRWDGGSRKTAHLVITIVLRFWLVAVRDRKRYRRESEAQEVQTVDAVEKGILRGKSVDDRRMQQST